MIVKRKNPVARTALYIILGITLLIYGYPLYFAVTTALKTNIDALSYPPKFLFIPTGTSFRNAFKNYDLLPALWNSIIISFSNMVLTLLAGTPAAYSLSRTNFRGKKLLTFWILTSRMIPPIVMVIPFFIISRSTGLYDTRLFLIFIYLTINLAFVVWMMKSFFDDIPTSLDEAALIDGCSQFQAFRKIILPLTLPGLVSTAIFCLMFTWNEFMFALALTEYNASTLPVAFSKFIGYAGTSWAELSASAVVTMLPILIAATLVQKHIVKGLTGGAIK
jgi:multiple sugar transport system permease protein